MVDKVNSLLEFFRQKEAFSAEFREHGMTEEEVDALHWTWHDLGWAHTRLTEEQWERVAGNQQAPHRQPRTAEQVAEELGAPVKIAGEMDQVDNIKTSEPFDQQIHIQSEEHVHEAKELARINRLVRG